MIIVVDPDPELASQLKRLVDDSAVTQVSGVPGARELLEDRVIPVEAVVLGPQLTLEEAVRGARTLRQTAPTVNLVLVTGEATPDVLREAMRAGISDVLERRPADDHLLDAVNRARQLTNELRAAASGPSPSDATSNRRTITVFSTKGGSGKSLLATNLAVLLAAEAPDEVVLVDLDLHSGDDAVMLQLLPSWTIADAAAKGATLDAEQLRGFLTSHPSRVRLLAAPTHPAQADDIKPEAVQHILSLLRGMFRYVVVDGPAQFTEPLLTAIDQTDVIVVVAMMDVPSIKNLRVSTQTLQELGIPRDRLRLVLNRADSKVGLTVKEIEGSLGTQIDAQVPSSREVPYAVNQGQPIVTERPRSGVSDAIRGLLDQVRDRPRRSRQPDDSRRSRLFGGRRDG
jgi:pilus assembly protein CpaE